MMIKYSCGLCLLRPPQPDLFRKPNAQPRRLTKPTHQWKPQQRRLGEQLLHPARAGDLRVAHAQLLESLRIPIDERLEPETLDKSLQLTFCQLTFLEIHEVRANASLGKEPQRLSCVGALLRSEYLNFHGGSR